MISPALQSLRVTVMLRPFDYAETKRIRTGMNADGRSDLIQRKILFDDAKIRKRSRGRLPECLRFFSVIAVTDAETIALRIGMTLFYICAKQRNY